MSAKPVIHVQSKDGLVAIGEGEVAGDVEHAYAVPGAGVRTFTLKQTTEGDVYLVEVTPDETEELISELLVTDGGYDAYVAANGVWSE